MRGVDVAHGRFQDIFFSSLISPVGEGRERRDEVGKSRQDGGREKKEINERKRDTMGEGPGWGTGSAVL